MIGFRCECGPAIDCTYPKCKEGVETNGKDITERLQDYARDYTTTTYHDDLIREAVTEIESLRQQLALWKAAAAEKNLVIERLKVRADEVDELRQQLASQDVDVARQILRSERPSMTKRHCYVTDVGVAIEKLADALDPERSKPFTGDILDLLEWATKDVLELKALFAELDRVATHNYATKDAEIDELKNELGVVKPYAEECSKWMGGYNALRGESESLRQQVILLRDALLAVKPLMIPDVTWTCNVGQLIKQMVQEALDATKEN